MENQKRNHYRRDLALRTYWKTARHGDKGTINLLETHGNQLLAVRYYKDGKKKFKTVELIVPLRKWKRRRRKLSKA